ncbi:succinate dehydrogenase, cytochrome b556 subunit [Citricoccus sp. GCM10030269]|uniref:succinate dehydrogenase, cytochrome b556 subunit n=1 Tax=Citricoccus sp. GCM10030269 TaxID=3273388 RepID=UPI0036203D9F
MSTATSAQAPAKSGRGTLYRGTEGQWSWVIHRITGVVIFFFLLVHVLDTSLVRVSPEAYNAVLGTYKNPLMALGEVGLVGAIVFHAFNGVRIILVDFWKGGTQHHKKMLWAVVILSIITIAAFAIRHLMLALGGH